MQVAIYLQEELSRSGIENENSTVDWLCRQIALERLVNSNAVDVGIVDKPNDLVGEELRIVLAVEVRLCWLRRVQLKTLANTFAQYVACWVCFHNLGHRLLHEWLHAREPISESRPKIIRQIHAYHYSRRRWVDTH